jgi:primary-amine oxidase
MAYATIAFGATEEPYLEDFLIGPLPVTNETTCVAYSFRTTKGTSRIRSSPSSPSLPP